jgi:hypothetical protein
MNKLFFVMIIGLFALKERKARMHHAGTAVPRVTPTLFSVKNTFPHPFSSCPAYKKTEMNRLTIER